MSYTVLHAAWVAIKGFYLGPILALEAEAQKLRVEAREEYGSQWSRLEEARPTRRLVKVYEVGIWLVSYAEMFGTGAVIFFIFWGF